MRAQQAAVVEAAVGGKSPACGEQPFAHRHILVPRLQRRIAPQREYLRAGAVLIELARPIIVDLMVVERAGEGARRVRRLQGKIGTASGRERVGQSGKKS